MQDHAPPTAAGNAAVGAEQEGLTPERVEAVLADFRSWLERAPAAAAPPALPQPLDLHTLLSQFVALRHEVNLQTKASRAQQEQNAEALRHMEEALELLDKQQQALTGTDEQAREEQVRPLLKTLVDLHDSLSLAAREVQRVQDTMAATVGKLEAPPAEVDLVPEPLPAPPPPVKRSLWGRLFGGAPSTPPAGGQTPDVVQPWRDRLAKARMQLLALRQSQEEARQAAERVRVFVTSLVTGYTMSVQRLERALRQHELEPIPTVGQPFDPETMEVVEVVTDSGRTSTEVIEEVRRGYRWRGRVFRYAQVRVAKP
jgi:molecular chaperone GrpE